MNQFLEQLAEFKEKYVIHTGWKVIKFDRYVKNNVDVTNDIRAIETEILDNPRTCENKIGKYFAILSWMNSL